MLGQEALDLLRLSGRVRAIRPPNVKLIWPQQAVIVDREQVDRARHLGALRSGVPGMLWIKGSSSFVEIDKPTRPFANGF
jgi:hypothetical protein